MTEQRTEDRGQKTEDRRQSARFARFVIRGQETVNSEQRSYRRLCRRGEVGGAWVCFLPRREAPLLSLFTVH
jgi:hypothetical protein